MSQVILRTRNPFLVILWTFGLTILLSLPQIIWVWSGGEQPEAGVEGANPTLVLGKALLVLIIGIPLVLVTVRFLWRRPAALIRLAPRPGQFLFGLLGGILAPLPPLLILVFAGVASISAPSAPLSPFAAFQVLAGYLFFFSYAAAIEELIYRGMAAREIAARWGWPAAWLVSGAYFGLVHFQPGLGVPQMLWLILSAILVSGLFIALYRRGCSLWLPIGFHLGWNFCLSSLLGATMSGNESTTGLLATRCEGSFLMTGGSFGMEISAVTLLFYLLYALLALRLPRRDGAPLLEARLSHELSED